MKKTVLEVYAMAVCFVTVVCFVVASAIALYAVLGMARPEFTMPAHTYESFLSNDAYYQFYEGSRVARVFPGREKENAVRPPEATLTRLRTEAFARAVLMEARDNTQTLVKSLLVMLVDALVFAAHWMLARRSRVSAA